MQDIYTDRSVLTEPSGACIWCGFPITEDSSFCSPCCDDSFQSAWQLDAPSYTQLDQSLIESPA